MLSWVSLVLPFFAGAESAASVPHASEPHQPSPSFLQGFPSNESLRTQFPLQRTYDLLIRGDRGRMGEFDHAGNFIPLPNFEPEPPGGSFNFLHGTYLANNYRKPTTCAEHRSGRLICGTMVDGIFIPEIDSKVLDLHNDFDIKTPDKIVYNIPSTAFAYMAAGQKNQPPMGYPLTKDPPEAGTPAGWKLIPFSEALKLNRDLWHIRLIGDIAEFGHLDSRGEFIPDYDLPIVARDGLRGIVENTAQLNITRRYFTLPLDGAKSERVYEFRSGRLIAGTLHDTGNFVPEVGSTILDFKDYDPNGRRRIYNLPGVLRKVEK